MKRPSLRVLFLPLYPETMPSSRLRIYQYLPYLKQYGIEGEVKPALPDPWFSRCYYSSSKMTHFFQHGIEAWGSLRHLFESRRYDVAMVQKGILTTNVRGWDYFMNWANPKLVFDMDDAVYGKNAVEFQSPFFRFFQDRQQTEKISSRARAVIAGNGYLKGLAQQYNQNVFVISTPVDTRRFCPQKKKSDSKEIVIGWIGVGASLIYLQLLHNVLQEIARHYPVRLKIISRVGEKPFTFPGVPSEMIPWSYETEVEEMADFDIGVMPLKEEEWARGKCGLKLLQYMSMGIPSVSTRFGVNSEIVEEGEDGFLAQKPEEWVEKLSKLIQDKTLRQKISEQARKKVVEKYSLEKTAPLLAHVLREVGNGS